MSATALKIIAVICMTLDHLSTYLGAPLPFRYVGRIAAVIFFFCAAESTVHTSDRKRYLTNLYKMSLLMTGLSIVIPFILTGWIGHDFMPVRNNIFTELVPGVWLVTILEDTKNDAAMRKKRLRNYIIYQLVTIPIWLIFEMICTEFPFLPEQLTFTLGSIFISEGNIWLTLLILLFYLCRDSKKKLAVGYLSFCTVYALIDALQLPARALGFVNTHFNPLSMTVNNIFSILGFDAMQLMMPLSESLLYYNFQSFMVFALPLLLLYNGKRGKGFKRFFYVYYPAHIYVLYLIQQFFLS